MFTFVVVTLSVVVRLIVLILCTLRFLPLMYCPPFVTIVRNMLYCLTSWNLATDPPWTQIYHDALFQGIILSVTWNAQVN